MNNVRSFPGMLHGALETRARRYTPAMFVAAGLTIADRARDGELVPSPLDRSVHRAVTLEVARAAVESGVAHAVPDEELLAGAFGRYVAEYG